MSLFDQLAGAEGPSVPRCSRKGCRDDAAWSLLWNNPRLHSPERRKVWLACEGHRGWLEDYLATRGLLKQTLPFDLDDPPREA
ncbi:hypothetical protein ACQ3I4_02380 [Zafaria sp. Z1313]|uniref:hypothetical protein n=1 Tax=unclassified Zafaria TaxID=2828765 RepID=UPI002E79D1ED|nr:hypothetical protein [Zafaria sp. J156]MEE1620219.1 hypothetical protein [Zafaria sp. J156]